MLEIMKLNNKYLLVERREIEVDSIANYSFEVVKEFDSEIWVLDFLHCASELHKELNKQYENTEYEEPKDKAKIIQDIKDKRG